MKLENFNKELGRIIENVVKQEVLNTLNITEEEGKVCESCGLNETECKCPVTEQESDMEEGNEFSGARAKAIEDGEDTFEVDGKEYPVKGDKEEVNETKSGKKVLRLTESELIDLIEKLVSEQKVPGLDAYDKAHKESGKQNKENDELVAKKMKEYSDIEGNNADEFPNQNGGEVKAERVEKDEEIEFIEDMKGGMTAIEYDRTDDKFDERVEKQLKGDSTQGNAQVDEDGEALGNVVPTETGDKFNKARERQGLAKEKKKGYNTFPQKVETVKESMINEKVLSDMDKMKHLVLYSKRTQ
jgi:hypothetical protein